MFDTYLATFQLILLAHYLLYRLVFSIMCILKMYLYHFNFSVAVFKVFSIEEDEFVERCNLRVGKNLNLNFSASDVMWNPIDG